MVSNHVINSPLELATETSRVVLEANNVHLPIHIDTRLKEKNGGLAEGMRIEDVLSR